VTNSSLPAPEVLLGLNRAVTVARLLSGAIHDVNNALQVIAGSIELLEGRPDLPEHVTRGLARMRNQSGRAAAALERVTSFTKASTEDTTIVNLRDMAQRRVALREFAVRKARLSIRLSGDGEAALNVSGNRTYIEQAILNLIVNAEEGLAASGGGGEIDVQVTADAGWAVVRVFDNGPGISPAVAERLFQPFAAAPTDQHTAGLGLWAARTIAERHGGTLSHDTSAPGTAFVFRLPRV
jgi:two-component system sensor kinase FixL